MRISSPPEGPGLPAADYAAVGDAVAAAALSAAAGSGGAGGNAGANGTKDGCAVDCDGSNESLDVVPPFDMFG